MNPQPTGRIQRTASGRDLVLVRTFQAPIEDVWASITESDRTARWFGAWSGEAGVGRTVRFTMTLEEGSPSGDLKILACDPPRHLAVETDDASGRWQLEARLSETDGVTELRFTHHLADAVDVGSVGPGWEYYLDVLAASREDRPLPQFGDYYPAQREWYLSQDRPASAAE